MAILSLKRGVLNFKTYDWKVHKVIEIDKIPLFHGSVEREANKHGANADSVYVLNYILPIHNTGYASWCACERVCVRACVYELHQPVDIILSVL